MNDDDKEGRRFVDWGYLPPQTSCLGHQITTFRSNITALVTHSTLCRGCFSFSTLRSGVRNVPTFSNSVIDLQTIYIGIGGQVQPWIISSRMRFFDITQSMWSQFGRKFCIYYEWISTEFRIGLHHRCSERVMLNIVIILEEFRKTIRKSYNSITTNDSSYGKYYLGVGKKAIVIIITLFCSRWGTNHIV